MFLVYAPLVNKVHWNSVTASSLRFVLFYHCVKPHYLKTVVIYSVQFSVQGLKLPAHSYIIYRVGKKFSDSEKMI